MVQFRFSDKNTLNGLMKTRIASSSFLARRNWSQIGAATGNGPLKPSLYDPVCGHSTTIGPVLGGKQRDATHGWAHTNTADSRRVATDDPKLMKNEFRTETHEPRSLVERDATHRFPAKRSGPNVIFSHFFCVCFS